MPMQSARVDATITVQASIEDAYEAWTKTEWLARWFKPSADSVCRIIIHEPIVGGEWRIEVTRPDGEMYRVGGHYLELSRPDRLRFTWAWEEGAPDDFHDETTVLVDFVRTKKGTRIHVQHDRVPAQLIPIHHEGWMAALDLLKNIPM